MIFLLGCDRGWLRKIADPNYNGCTDKSACNYNKLSYVDDGSCVSPQGCNQWCEGADGSALELDCANQCGGSSINDECGVCDGTGIIQDCGCGDPGVFAIPEGKCDCNGNIYDECCICGGNGIPLGACDCEGSTQDEDLDGICDWNDGDSYNTVLIGQQVWMIENLKSTQYKNGDKISKKYACTESSNDKYYLYNNNGDLFHTYGNLYNWYTVNDSRGLCQEGFHIPTNEDWGKLIDYLGGKGVAGGKIKEAGTEHWKSPNTGATNESSFTALPGGFFMQSNNSFQDLGNLAYFWTSTIISDSKASNWIVGYNLEVVQESETYKTNGLSVRCIKDD